MGQKDVSLVRYFEDQDRFADLINGFIFKGKQIISGEDILEMDSRVTGTFGRLKKRIMVQKYRDCVRKIVFGTNFVIIGIETDLREVFGFIQRSGDMSAEQKFTKDNEERFKALDEEAFDVIVSVTGARELEMVKEQFREEGGKINMCEAIRGMIEQGREEGIKEGLQKGLQEGKVEGQKEKAYITARNMFLRGFTVEETAGLLEESLDTVKGWYESWCR